MASLVGVVKLVVSGIVGAGTKKIVTKFVTDIITPETVVEKVTITAATWVITGMVTKATADFTDDKIDAAISAGAKLADKWKLQTKLVKISKKESTFEEEGLDETRYERNSKGYWIPIKPKGKVGPGSWSRRKDVFYHLNSETDLVSRWEKNPDTGKYEKTSTLE